MGVGVRVRGGVRWVGYRGVRGGTCGKVLVGGRVHGG